jgi:O-antigen/teichoic acid export membrane protein
MTDVPGASMPDPRAAPLRADVHTAAGNALKLGASLIGTWGVALLVRLYLPRYLGPEAFGLYSFADSFAITCVGFLSLGVDSYVQKEIPVRPAHASDFFGGVMVLRLLLGIPALLILQELLALGGRPAEAHLLVLAFGSAYLLTIFNASFGALLQANTKVDGLAVTNVLIKVLWAALIGVGMACGASVVLLATAFVVSEAVKSLVLGRVVRRDLGLVLRVDRQATWAVIVASLPYYTNAVALSLNRLDVTVLTFMTGSDREVGYYGAASNLSGLALMLAPLLASVLLPLMSRAHARSSAELDLVVSQAARGLVELALPIALFLALGADYWVRLAFGAQYAPAAASLRALAPQFVFTYVAALLSMTLMVRGRGWAMTGISIFGVLVNPLLCALCVPIGARLLGEGGAGAGAALGVVGMEVAVSALMLRALGGSVFDAAGRRAVAGLVLLCLALLVLDVPLRVLGFWRLPLEFALYLALASATGLLRVRALLDLARELRASRATAPENGAR